MHMVETLGEALEMLCFAGRGWEGDGTCAWADEWSTCGLKVSHAFCAGSIDSQCVDVPLQVVAFAIPFGVYICKVFYPFSWGAHVALLSVLVCVLLPAPLQQWCFALLASRYLEARGQPCAVLVHLFIGGRCTQRYSQVELTCSHQTCRS